MKKGLQFFTDLAMADIFLYLLFTTFFIICLLLFIVKLIAHHYRKKAFFEQALINIQQEIQEEILLDVSREIHDNIGLSLTLAKLQLNTLPSKGSTKQAEMISSVVDLISNAICDLNDISKSLNAESVRTQGFLSALNSVLAKLRKTGKYEVVLEINGPTAFLPDQIEIVLYRVAQEALNNIIKHSQARRIAVGLTFTDAYFQMEISDDGVGIDWDMIDKNKSKKVHMGILSMKARAQMVKGDFQIIKTTSGTKIKLIVPK